MSGRLDGKVTFITGTAGGQGRAAALAFAAEGAKVVGCDLQAEGSDDTLHLVRDAGSEMISMAPVNLSSERDVMRWFAFGLDAYGRIDVLYNNASGARFGTVDEMSREDWDYTLANELTLIFLTVKHATPVFKRQRRGVILNTASIAGLVGSGAVPSNGPGGLAHAATKAGVIAMTRVLACELSPWNVRVNCISPGGILTPGLAPVLGDENGPMRKAYIGAQLIDRIGLSEDIARAAVFLASDDSAYITGENLVVDGGYVAAGGAGRPGALAVEGLKFN